MKPFSTSVLKLPCPLEYLLLPPRSALKAVPQWVSPLKLPNNLHASSYLSSLHINSSVMTVEYRYDHNIILERHPF